nr:uncharacterized protein LOC127313090 isoform X3 [Lolium perenne]
MMDARRWQSPAAAAAAAEAAEEDAGGGGGGGPSRRPPRRGVHRASPYGVGPRRWLPKAPVASRIFPAVSLDRAAADDNRVDQRESMDVTHEASSLTHGSKSTEPNTDAITNVAPALVNKVNLLPSGDHIHQNGGSVLSEIEKIIKQNQFSRDETERLIEILRMRTPDLHDEDQRALKHFAKDSEATQFSNKLVTAAKPDAQNWGIDVFAPPIVHDVGTSPVELARAYMEAQTSATVHESQKRKFRALSHGVEIDNSASKLFPKVAVDSTVGWPGSVVRDHTNYLTPQSNKRRALPPASSRSPYSGPVFRKSVKRTGNLDTYSNSSVRPQLSTPFSVGSKAILEDRTTTTDDVLGVQPSTSSERACADTDGTNTPFFPRDGSAAMKNPTFSLERPHGKGTIDSGSAIGRIPAVDNSRRAALSVHPKSSQTAQKILQHLERTIPSPTAKPLDLRRTAKKTTPVVISSPYKFPDSITGNGPRQSSVNERGSAYQAISDVKVQEPPSSSNCEVPAPKIQSHVVNSEVAEVTSSQHPSKTNLTTAPAAMVLEKSTNNGFMFSFPVTKTSVSLPEPPPTPSFFSPPKRSLPADVEDIPKFTFGSSGSADNLIFTVDPASGSAGADEVAPTFSFGSEKKRELSFDVAGKGSLSFPCGYQPFLPGVVGASANKAIPFWTKSMGKSSVTKPLVQKELLISV